MKHARPIARDGVISPWPVAAAHHVSTDVRGACRTPVTHSYAALAFHTAGRTRVEQDGAWSLVEGDVLIVPAGAPHRRIEVQRPEYWALALCVPCVAADGAAALLEPFERVRDGASPVVRVPAARRGFLEALFRELEEAGRRAYGATLDAVQRSLLTLILAEVDRADSPPASRGAARVGVVAESLRFIERNCLRRLTLDEIAASVGRSPTYVTSALTRATGRSAGQWIVSGRMAEARRLLLHSDEMVDVIAERVGYADSTHFIRVFRREHGATPAAWRATRARSQPG